MRIQLPVKGISQYDASIESKLQGSACGPVTAHVILNYLSHDMFPYETNEVYRLIGGTRLGLGANRFIRKLRKLLGPSWIIEKCDIEQLKNQLQESRPVAAKFDKWFSFRWFGRFTFDYHWVPVIGYEEKEGDLFLIIHDNGGRNRESQIRTISYKNNQPILTFVKIEPRKK